MGTIVKILVLGLALCSLLFLVPVWFPKLLATAFVAASIPVSWGLVLIFAVMGSGFFYLKSK